MTRPTPWLLRLLRKLLTLVSGSTRRLLLLFSLIQRRFLNKTSFHGTDTPSTSISPLSQASHANSFPASNVICPSLQPPSREANSISPHASYNHDEQHIQRPIHSPIPQEGYLLPYA